MSDDLQPEDLVDKATAWDVLTKKNDQIADLRAQLAEANKQFEDLKACWEDEARAHARTKGKLAEANARAERYGMVLHQLRQPVYLGNQDGLDFEALAKEMNRRQALAEQALSPEPQEPKGWPGRYTDSLAGNPKEQP